ncbi:hypothetical protein HZS_4949 [Henneguya salminicola]|nr:hypothetical protein HZS_4949 [Henneguya salminicola]
MPVFLYRDCAVENIMKLLDIIQICLSQENKISYLTSQNLLSTEQKCKQCRNKMILSSTADTKSKDGQIWRCYKKKCDQTRSIRPWDKYYS